MGRKFQRYGTDSTNKNIKIISTMNTVIVKMKKSLKNGILINPN